MDKAPDNKLSVESHGVLGHARLYDAEGNEILGHLSVREDGTVVFVNNFPGKDLKD
jgi:hypothetical protein